MEILILVISNMEISILVISNMEISILGLETLYLGKDSILLFFFTMAYWIKISDIIQEWNALPTPV